MANQSEVGITLINLFTVKPEKQQSAADQVAEIYQTIVSKQPGFISARVHKSLDGTGVAAIPSKMVAKGIARWQSQEALTAMQQKPEFQSSVKILEEEIVSAEHHSFEVIYTVGEDE